MFKAKHFSCKFLKFLLNSMHTKGSYMKCKYLEPLWIKTSIIKEIRRYVKTTHTSLRCYGKPDCNKPHFSWDLNLLNLLLEKLWQLLALFNLFLMVCDSCSNVDGITSKKSNRTTLNRGACAILAMVTTVAREIKEKVYWKDGVV